MKTTPRSRLLLIELVCDFIIFALCAAVCVTLLVRARSMSEESTQLTQAVYLAQTAAEQYLAGEEFGGEFGDFIVVYNDLDPIISQFPNQSILVLSKGRNGQGDELIYSLPILDRERGDAP